jgi:uncharacterized protein YcgL (UPF0745 family)
MTTPSTTCYVYKSLRKRDTYVYLRQRDDFSVLPQELAVALGELAFVLELELAPDRKLARELAPVVLDRLAERGFHLQLPPVDPLQE